MRTPTDAEATALIDASDFVWHQSFRLSENVWAPGVNVVDDLFARSTIPASLDGLTVLDIGTTNGASAFEAERRGASRIVAVDICDDRLYGFGAIAALLDSKAEFVTATVYEIDSVLDEQFDIVIFWGVLYHLRHPLLGLDAVRRVSRGLMTLETVVNDAVDGDLGPLARFHRLDDLGGDGTNWWSPSTTTLREWITSAGFDVTSQAPAPPEGPATRIVVDGTVTPGDPEYRHVSYEMPLRVSSPITVAGDAPAPVTIDDIVALRSTLLGDDSGRHLDDARRVVAKELEHSDLAGAAAKWIASDQFVTTWPTNSTFRRVQGDAQHHTAAPVRPIVRLCVLDDGPDELDVALASVIDPTLVQVGRSLDEILSLPLARLLSLRLISGVHGRAIADLLRARNPLTIATVLDPVEFHVRQFGAALLDGTVPEGTTFEHWLEHTTLPADPQTRRLASDALAPQTDDRSAATSATVDSVIASIQLLAPADQTASLLAATTSAANLPATSLGVTESSTSAAISDRCGALIAERSKLDAELHRRVVDAWANRR